MKLNKQFMRFILIPTLLFLTFALANGQNFKISGKVTDSDNEEELPFANIMVVNYTIGTTSDSQGFFELSLADSLKNDSLIISYVGYQTLILCLNDIRGDIVRLKPKNIKLNEVVIRPSKKKIKLIIVNQFKPKNCNLRYSSTNTNTDLWIPYRPKEPTIEALYFPYKKEYGGSRRVKEVWLKVSNLKTPPTYFNLRIFNASDDQIPDYDLLSESIIIKVTESKHLIKVNLEEYNLVIPENGLFVGFELLIIDENKSTVQDKKGSTFTLYSPYLNFLRLKDEQHFWLYTKGKWIEIFQKTPHYIKKNVMLFYKPAISLVLSD